MGDPNKVIQRYYIFNSKIYLFFFSKMTMIIKKIVHVNFVDLIPFVVEIKFFACADIVKKHSSRIST